MNNQYSKEYSDKSLIEKIKQSFSKAGVSVIYGTWLLYYALNDSSVPKRAKATIICALGYFISPIDIVPDYIPIVGYGDDFSAIITALGVISMFITEDMKQKARQRTQELFKNVKEEDFKRVDSKLV